MNRKWRKAASSVLEEWLVAFNMEFFAGIEKRDRALADTFRADFHQYMDTLVELMKEKPGKHTPADIFERIPDNKWLTLLLSVHSIMEPNDDNFASTRKELRKEVKRRLRGTNIQ